MTKNKITLSLASHEKRLLAQKNKFLPALTAAMEKHEESKREKLQLVVVTITEGLTFLRQSYKNELRCRQGALNALVKIQKMLDKPTLQLAATSLRTKVMTSEAEQVFDKLISKGAKIGAFAAFQSASLAECRIDFNRAMVRFDKALELDRSNIHYLKATGLLARKMYQYKKALNCFAMLEKLLLKTGKDSVQLALARRELAYTAALFGQHKQAGGYYKKAMNSLAKLSGKNDPELGICWYQLGLLQESLGQDEKAEGPYKKALAIIEKTDNDSIQADILDKIARLHMELEGEPYAIPLFERLLALKTKSSHPDLAGLIIIYNNLGEASRICGKYDQSAGYYKKALRLTQQLRGKEHPAVASLYQELAKLCERQRKPDEAKKYNQAASAIFQRVLEKQEAASGEQSDRLTL